MDSDLLECIYEYATRQGGVTMAEICLHNGCNGWYCQMERAQDAIGWWHFMERMVCNKIQAIQTTYLTLSRSPTSAEEWMVELITKLLQVTHGQWLYRNIQVHDKQVQSGGHAGYSQKGGDSEKDR